MSNYVKSTDFAAKDALASGNAAKIVKGTEIDTEFNNIATAVATKADLASPTFTGTPTMPTGTIAVTQSTSDDSTKLATTAFVQAVTLAVKNELYPVGSIYTNSSVSTNPGTLLGFGTWTAFGAGRVMVGFDSGNALFDTAEETGGSADAIVVSHTHTADSTTLTGSVNGTTNTTRFSSPSGVFSGSNSTTADAGTPNTSGFQTLNINATHTHTINSTGSSGTNANYQPYITVYMWKRTA